jgi:hypothetical protein
MDATDDFSDGYDLDTQAQPVETTRDPLFVAMAVGAIAAILLTLLQAM